MLYSVLNAVTSDTAVTIYALIGGLWLAKQGLAYAWRHRHQRSPR